MKAKENKKKSHGEFYGATRLGERGQIVIPAEARKHFNLKKGEQLLVFGMHNNMVALIKVDKVKELTKRLASKLSSIEGVLKEL